MILSPFKGGVRDSGETWNWEDHLSGVATAAEFMVESDDNGVELAVEGAVCRWLKMSCSALL